MSPEAELAELVDDYLRRHGHELDPIVAIAADGMSRIAEACANAQSKIGDWGGMLSKLRTGAAQLEAALARLDGKPGLERFVSSARFQLGLARTITEAIVRLQADAPTLVGQPGPKPA